MPSLLAWAFVGLGLALLCLSTGASAAEQVLVIRATAAADSADLVAKIAEAVQGSTNQPAEVLLRTVNNTAQAKSILLAGAPSSLTVQVAAGSKPLSASEASQLTGGVIHVPFAWSTLSVYTNVPGSNTLTLNLTACLVARILNGQITTWSAPEIADVNPSLTLATKDAAIVVLAQDAATADTQALSDYLTAACPASWAGTFATSATKPADMGMAVMHTPYSIGYLASQEGAQLGLREASLKNKAGQSVSSKDIGANITNTQAAIAALLPAAYDSSFDSISTLDMASDMIYPITLLHYLYVPKDVSAASWGATGALLQGLATFAVSSDGQGLTADTGLYPVGNTITTAASTSLGGMTLGGSVTAFTLEAAGTYSEPTGSAPESISGNRKTYESQMIEDLQAELADVKAQLKLGMPRVMRGSGSSGVQLVMWQLLDQFSSMSSTPVWLTYRAIGSGGGENEIVGPKNGYKPYVDFACSDVPMSASSWKALQNIGTKVVQVPIGVAAMSFFVNMPKDVVHDHGGSINLSPCSAAKIFSGVITSWDDADITADNGGKALPKQPITFLYRTSASGTTAVVTEYLNRACPASWTFGSGKTIAQWDAITNAMGAKSTLDLGQKLLNYTYSIGYMEAGVGATLNGATEVSMKNKGGNYLTSAKSDVSAAASQLFQSGGWPADPTGDFSAVSLLDQPGATTWPITSMPFMFVRTDMVDAGSAGPLLTAFINFMLQPTTQAQLTTLGFFPLPTDVLTYQQRALPLILTNTEHKQWYYESKATPYTAAGDNVVSDPTLKTTYTTYAITALQSDMAATKAAVANGTSLAGVNLTALASAAAGGQLSGATLDTIQSMNNRMDKLQVLAGAALAFGIIAMVLALFAVCRVYITGAIAPMMRGVGSSPSGGGNGSVHRKQSMNGGDASIRSGLVGTTLPSAPPDSIKTGAAV